MDDGRGGNPLPPMALRRGHLFDAHRKPIDVTISGWEGVQPEVSTGGERIGDLSIATGYDHSETGLRRGKQLFAIRQAKHDRLTAENILGHRSYSFDYPSL